MPIYEYECQSCRRIVSSLILKKEEEKEVQCPSCGGSRLTRVLSRFALHKTEDQRLQDFDAHKPQSDTFYNDRRNIGLWAKKRARNLAWIWAQDSTRRWSRPGRPGTPRISVSDGRGFSRSTLSSY